MEKKGFLLVGNNIENNLDDFHSVVECNKENKFLIVVGGMIFIGIIVYLILQSEKEQNKNIFSLNIESGGTISPIYDDIFNIDTLNNIFNKIEADKERIIFEKFDSFDEVEFAKKTKRSYLTDEIKYKILGNNNTKSKKKYVLISYIYKTKSHVILEKKVQIKEEYQNQLKNVENLEGNKKLNEYKKILKQIGFYVPTEVFYGGRVDITFEVENKDTEKLNNLNKTKDKIFDLNLNDRINSLKKEFRNVKCDITGGTKELFKKVGDLNKWIESLQNKNIKPEIILYDSLETIDHFFDSELSDSFFKFFYYNKKIIKSYKDGEYNGYVKNEIRDGEGKMEYTDGKTYTGFWENDKRKVMEVYLQMENWYIKVNGKMIKDMEKELHIKIIKKYMKVIGKMIKKMEKEYPLKTEK